MHSSKMQTKRQLGQARFCACFSALLSRNKNAAQMIESIRAALPQYRPRIEVLPLEQRLG
jgi:hypothetical protein